MQLLQNNEKAREEQAIFKNFIELYIFVICLHSKFLHQPFLDVGWL